MAKTTGNEVASAQPGTTASSGNGRKPRGQKAAVKAPRGMTNEHKQALALGRREGKAVAAYLDFLEQHKPKRGRKVTPETIRARIERISSEISEAAGSKKLLLIQERRDLEESLRRAEDTAVVDDLEKAFKEVAKSYSERHGISYDAFREAGVPVPVLREAGLARTA
jgi:hypothetical protein